jgi:hypothetical protein
MVFHLFDNRILTTPKCGTRYLRQKWEDTEITFKKIQITGFSNIKYLIIREPFEHLKSAIHTEFYNHKDLYSYDIIDFSNYLNKLLLRGEIAHWSYNMYEIMYWMYIKSNRKIKIIHLSSLTDFIKEQGYDIEYVLSDYTFNDSENWISKDDLFNKLLKNFPSQMQILLKQSDEQNIFYNKIINNTTQQQSLI